MFQLYLACTPMYIKWITVQSENWQLYSNFKLNINNVKLDLGDINKVYLFVIKEC